MKKAIILKYLSIFLFILFLGTQVTHSQSNLQGQGLCLKELDQLPIRQDGRVKPLRVHSKEVLTQLSGKLKRVQGLSATQMYCHLSLISLKLNPSFELMAPVQHVKIKALLGLEEDQKAIPYSQLLESQMQIRAELVKMKRLNPYKKALNKLLQRASLYRQVTQGVNWTLPLVQNQTIRWVNILEFLDEQRKKRSGAPLPAFTKVIEETKAAYKNAQGEDYETELFFSRLNPFRICLFVSFLALGLGVSRKMKKSYFAAIASTLILETTGIIFRILISGRAPITNMYETVMFSGYGALLLGLFLGWKKREQLYIQVGLAYNILTLLMMNFAHNMLNPNISPLVPVLRDNFWLSTHVTTVILSYAAFALSWLMANYALLKERFGSWEQGEWRRHTDLIYSTLKWGTVLLSAGLILGGVWADYSWGRFWGWDPKETWSLIVLCLYMAILHGRYTSWIPPQRFVPLVALAFLSVMMAWFGVNYILAAGLHSYGFSEGGAIFLGSFFLAQFVLLGVTLIRPGDKESKA